MLPKLLSICDLSLSDSVRIDYAFYCIAVFMLVGKGEFDLEYFGLESKLLKYFSKKLD